MCYTTYMFAFILTVIMLIPSPHRGHTPTIHRLYVYSQTAYIGEDACWEALDRMQGRIQSRLPKAKIDGECRKDVLA